jgi:hypothetical protein
MIRFSSRVFAEELAFGKEPLHSIHLALASYTRVAAARDPKRHRTIRMLVFENFDPQASVLP